MIDKTNIKCLIVEVYVMDEPTLIIPPRTAVDLDKVPYKNGNTELCKEIVS